ncbi:hypothetical protein GCM10011608_34730 [Micromonospora sonchi]|uniref:Uncharacterized protein n=1 Tax=Micromonospora sonchi TaxID=1763543 RepID=A0A917TZR9_9ACTN|nr:hypothetical protein [Micromonospora sonchi]GGM47000.1 hypothetical protein GCM10011608_34730 [Micromonospora sonchi]
MANDPPPVRVGVAGHINLTPATERLVADALRVELRRISVRPVHGVTCLAAGTDQVFARVVLGTGGSYEVVLPALDYRDSIDPAHRAAFDELLDRATLVVHTGHRSSGTAAYVAANRELLSRVERLVAVWDGEPGCHAASTDRTVRMARQRAIPTTIIWPAAARRLPRDH